MGNYTRDYARSNAIPNRNAHNLQGEYYGIELELNHPVGYQHLLRAMPDTKNRNIRPATEEDGSLDMRRGVEIVFPPLKASQINSPLSFFTKTIKALDAEGHNSSTGYGMHVNVNTSDWTPLEIAKMVTFFNMFPAARLANLGGRALNRWCQQYLITAPWAGAITVSGLVRSCFGSHGYVVSPRTGRLELRFPRATTDIYRIQSVVLFAQLARKYLSTVNNIALTTTCLQAFPNSTELEESFIEFIRSQPKSKKITRLLEFLDYAPSENRNPATVQAV